MKFYIHYTIWNKQDHIPWICEGIRSCIPKGNHVDFIFDNCTDASYQNFLTCLSTPEVGYGSLAGYLVTYGTSTQKHRWPNTNQALRRFMATDCDLFLSPQDDMKIQDKFICENLEKLYTSSKEVGLEIGMVGMRDGFDFEGRMFSACHSHRTAQPNTWLRSGNYKHVKYVNDGPICLDKNAVQKVGYFDEQYWAHYTDNDYCFRANEAGLKNFVMGAEIVHEKWGRVQPSEVWSQEYSTHDYEIYKKKWHGKI